MAKIDLRPFSAPGLEIVADFIAKLSQSRDLSSLYRGHPNSSWKPIASAFRKGEYGITQKDQLIAWRGMSQRFVNSPSASDLSYLVLAQHYGIPTGLLDWTRNPLIALFFACQPLEQESDGEVIAITENSFHKIERTSSVNVFKSDRTLPLLIDASAMNVRSTAQDSFMSLHTALDNPISYSSVFIVPLDKKSKVRAALSLFGLTPERIYADLTVAANNFKSQLKDEFDFQSLLGDLGLK